jgi:hypothetical protein
MTLVNRYWLDHIWGPIGEGKHVDSIVMADMSEPANVTRLVDEYLRPYFGRLPARAAARLKETFRYALNAYDDGVLHKALLDMLPPFEMPKDVRQLYVDVWRSLFPDEPWQVSDLGQYVDMNRRFVSPFGDL